MTVLLVSNMYPRGASYAGVFVKRQAKALESRGVRLRRIMRTATARWTYVPFLARVLLATLFSSYDIVHAHYGFHAALIPALFKRKKLVITFHGSDVLVEPRRSALYRRLQGFVVQRADALVAVSNGVRQALVEGLGADAWKITVISCGVDTTEFRPRERVELRRELGLPEARRIVLFAGGVRYMKGVDVLYEAAAKLPDALFVLVGDGPLGTTLANCRLVGAKPMGQMPKWMGAADVFVLPSRSEGTPVTVLEAMACGTPVVSTAVGGCPDVIREAVMGYLVPVGDAETLRQRLGVLLDSGQLRQRMGKECRRLIVEEYDASLVADRIKRVYGRLGCRYERAE